MTRPSMRLASGNAGRGVAVFVHLQIAEDAADSIDERVAESVIVLVYGEARYCRGETCGKAQISGGVGSGMIPVAR